MVIDGFKGSAFQTDDQQNGGVYTTELNLKNGSKLTATKCYAGITSTIQVTVEDSELVNCDHRGNGSNGADYIFKNATADISGNGAHGMSARNITAEDSTLTCSNNGMTGIIFTGTADFKNSDVTITGTKGKSYWNAGMRLMKANARGTVDQDTKLTITGNYVSGVFLDSSSKLTIADGADVLISGNLAEQANCSKEKELARKGGGIVVRADASAALPASAKIYNNHAAIAGDDIYVEDGGTISFGEVGADWYLDGTPDHCKDQIDGWYHDGHFVNEAGRP